MLAAPQHGCPKLPSTPRLAPQAAPFPLDELPDLELPRPMVEDSALVESACEPSIERDVVLQPPRAPCLRPAPSPHWQQLIPALKLPEAALDDWSFSLTEPEEEEVAPAYSGADKATNDVQEFHFAWDRGFSDASTFEGYDSEFSSPSSWSSTQFL